MKTKPERRGLNTAQAVLVLLFLVGITLASWVERTRAEAARRIAQLSDAKDRIYADVIKPGDVLQGLLVDTKNTGDIPQARETLNNLSGMIDLVQSQFPDYASLIPPLKTLHDLYNRLLDSADSDPAGAVAYYKKNYAAIQSQREQLLNELARQVQDISVAESAKASRNQMIGLVSLLLILIAGLLIIWLKSAALARPLAQLNETLERMRRGDFTQRLALDGPGHLGELGDGLNQLADDLSALVGQVQRSGIQVNATATQIAATAREQQSTAHEIAATTAEIGATSKEISVTSRELVKTIDEVTHVARDTAQLANSGQTAIARMEATMRQIIEASGSITAKLAVLNEKTANINSVVTTITKVADQTNLLSLNAAIEAEKAGEYGLGFAVVAMEIRRLADQTAVATYDIEKTVKEMQSAMAAGVMGLDKFSEEVRRGVEEIRQVSTQLALIIHQVQMLTPRFQTVNEGMHAQAAGAEQISGTLTQLGEAARQTAESLRQSNLAIEQLNEAARGLQNGVVRFKLEK
jgi:methyl-accepting chemotaxis protein WspA